MGKAKLAWTMPWRDKAGWNQTIRHTIIESEFNEFKTHMGYPVCPVLIHRTHVKIPQRQIALCAYLLQSCYISDASTPVGDTSFEPFAIISGSSHCYGNGYFAPWSNSPAFGCSSMSDTELGLGMTTVLSAILWCLSSFGLMPLLTSSTFGACRSMCIDVYQCSRFSIFCWYSCKVGSPASFILAYSHSSAYVIAYFLLTRDSSNKFGSPLVHSSVAYG